MRLDTSNDIIPTTLAEFINIVNEISLQLVDIGLQLEDFDDDDDYTENDSVD
jgi:hypothetical protein